MSLRQPCAKPCCPALVPVRTRHCPKHQRQSHARDRERRGSSYQRGYGKRWRKLRLIILARDPICVDCGIEPSIHVDHIKPKPIDVDAADFTEEELQGMCETCHNRKTRGEMNG